MELFARFVLDGIGIILQAIDVLADAGVFVFQLLDLVFKLFFLAMLAVPGGEAVAAIDDAPGESESESHGEDRAGGTPALLEPMDDSLR